MEYNREFKLQEYISNWVENLRTQPSFTDSDVEELKSHFLDIIDDLQSRGLDEEEACYIASKRLGSSFEWEEDFKAENNSVIQLRKSVMILSGIIAYFFFYYFVLFITKLLLYILLVSNVEAYTAINWNTRILISIHFLLIICTVSIYFLEDRAIKLIESINFKPKRIIILLLSTSFIVICDSFIYAVVKHVLLNNTLKSLVIHNYLYFNYSFYFSVCICFLFLYLKFNKKN